MTLTAQEQKLTAEVERLKKYIADYSSTVTQKIDLIEKDLVRMDAENSRLILAKDLAFVERDACIGLLVKLAMASGWRAGVAHGNAVIIDLPNGQVSWEFNESEAHLFSGLPTYPNSIEEITIEEKYSRVMNANLPV